MNYNFEWNPLKARANIKKHKITFERASKIFLDQFALSIFDEKHSIDEDRWITIGKTKSDNLIVVIHTFHYIDKKNIRIRIM